MKIFHYLLITFLLASVSLNVWFFSYFQLNIQKLLTVLPVPFEQGKLSKITPIEVVSSSKVSQTNLLPTGDDSPVVQGKSQAIVAKFTQSLLANEYRLAAEYFEEALSEDEALRTEMKGSWLNDLTSLIQLNKFLQAEKSINAFLEYKFDDIDFLKFKVTLFEAQKDYPLAIKNAYNIQYYLFDAVTQQESISYARKIAQAEVNRLEKEGLWLDILALVENIQSYDPAFDFYQWHLALSLYELGELERSLDQLPPLLTQSNYVKNAKELAKKIEKSLQFEEKDAIEIPLKAIGKHFTVIAEVGHEVEMTLLLDTGASITTISQQKFDEISATTHAELIHSQKFNTAGGVVYSNVYRLEHFQIGSISIEGFHVAVNESLSSTTDDGLLGMNFLNLFDFYIDQSSKVLQLSQKISD